MSTPRARAGSEVLIRTWIYNQAAIPPVLFDPDTSVKIKLYDPTGALILNDVTSTKLSTGIYQNVYQTTGASALGIWQVEFTAIHAGNTVISPRTVAFNLILVS